MGHWSFVFLAYGIVWCSIAVYTLLLKRRIRRAAAAAETPRSDDRGELT